MKICTQGEASIPDGPIQYHLMLEDHLIFHPETKNPKKSCFRSLKIFFREKHGIADGPIPYHLLLEDQAAKEAEEAADAAMEAAIARDSG